MEDNVNKLTYIDRLQCMIDLIDEDLYDIQINDDFECFRDSSDFDNELLMRRVSTLMNYADKASDLIKRIKECDKIPNHSMKKTAENKTDKL